MTHALQRIALFTVVLSAGPLASWRAAAAAAPTPPAEEKLVADGLALLREWHPPVYPAAELKARGSGLVPVRLIVDDAGRVTAARALEEADAAFVDAALAAVNSWVFAPAIERSQPVACCLDTVVEFTPALGQQKPAPGNLPPAYQTFAPAPRVAPEPTVTPSGGYPEVLRERKLPGTVRFSCVVSPAGRAQQARVIVASHVDFVLPALAALNDWEFSPAKWGDLTVAAPVEGVVTFDSIAANLEEVFAANGLTAPDGTVPAITPEPVFVADAVWPLERLLQGESGSATVEFTLTPTGLVKSVTLREATQPEFGAALIAAVETSGFQRPIENHRAVSVTLARRVEFKAVPLDATEASNEDPLSRLVLALRRGEVAGAKGLDAKLAPLYRVRPNYPLALTGQGSPAGKAEIEFIVDREGRARLPRVISATHPEFGWAAATAVAQWIFVVPRRAGEPVDVKVKIPFDFAPPES